MKPAGDISDIKTKGKKSKVHMLYLFLLPKLSCGRQAAGGELQQSETILTHYLELESCDAGSSAASSLLTVQTPAMISALLVPRVVTDIESTSDTAWPQGEL